MELVRMLKVCMGIAFLIILIGQINLAYCKSTQNRVWLGGVCCRDVLVLRVPADCHNSIALGLLPACRVCVGVTL